MHCRTIALQCNRKKADVLDFTLYIDKIWGKGRSLGICNSNNIFSWNLWLIWILVSLKVIEIVLNKKNQIPLKINMVCSCTSAYCIQIDPLLKRTPSFCPNGILLWKLFWNTVRKNCSSVREKKMKFEAKGPEFAKI